MLCSIFFFFSKILPEREEGEDLSCKKQEVFEERYGSREGWFSSVRLWRIEEKKERGNKFLGVPLAGSGDIAAHVK